MSPSRRLPPNGVARFRHVLSIYKACPGWIINQESPKGLRPMVIAAVDQAGFGTCIEVPNSPFAITLRPLPHRDMIIEFHLADRGVATVLLELTDSPPSVKRKRLLRHPIGYCKMVQRGRDPAYGATQHVLEPRASVSVQPARDVHPGVPWWLVFRVPPGGWVCREKGRLRPC